jgi:hypothetical protein
MIKITPSSLMTISATLCLALAAHTSAHAQADATGAGFKRGTWKYQMGGGNGGKDKESPGFTTLMENVYLRSSSGDQASDVVAFGPYMNNSEYPLTLTLNPIGNGRRKQAVIFIGNTEMIRAHDEPISYTIPAKASYSFHVQNERAITAMVPVDLSKNKEVILQLGLPTAQEFTNPMPIGAYMGCVDSWRSSWNSPSEGAPFVWAQDFIATYYYYAMGGWSDGSAHGYRDRAVSTANNAPVMLGPQQPGPCVERGKEPQPAVAPGSSSPESRSSNRSRKAQ